MAYQGIGAINCGYLPFGGQGLTDPACWCLTVGPKICDAVAGTGTYAAALALNSGGPAPPPPPPVVAAPDPNTPPPNTAAEANATINAIIANQWQAWKDQNADFFAQVADAAAANTPAPITVPVWAWVVGGIAAVVLLKGVLR